MERQLSKLDRIQLTQKIIHLQSELALYKQKVEKYQNNYHYKQVDDLRVRLEEMKGQHREYEARIEELTKKKAVLEEENANLVKASAQIYESTEELNIKIQQLEEENARLKKGNVEREGDFHKKEQEEKRYLLEKDEDSPDSWFLRTIRSQKNGE